MADSPITTPKRKRSQLLTDTAPSLNTTKFSFAVPPSSPEDGSNSPRTRVAHRFRGLALEGGGGVTDKGHDFSHDAMQEDTDVGVRKRVRLPEVDQLSPELYETRQLAAAIAETATEAAVASEPLPVQDGANTDEGQGRTVTHTDTVTTHRTFPLMANEAGHKPRSPRAASPNRPRSGSPPLTTSASALEEGVVEPIRAALTWHEDEITVYDPDDSDDDGTGINGIGFKPTPAIAHARTMRRKQQLAEYRKREEREARARRSQRRRGSPAAGMAEVKARAERRRVRFMEAAG